MIKISCAVHGRKFPEKKKTPVKGRCPTVNAIADASSHVRPFEIINKTMLATHVEETSSEVGRRERTKREEKKNTKILLYTYK